jgi:HKD family nuclease
MVDFIDNDSICLRDVLKLHLSDSDEALFALAFIRQSGVNMIFPELLKMIQRGGKVSILFANDFGATEAEAIVSLREIGVQLRYYSKPNSSFHIKAYLFKKPISCMAVIGSSNLSASGLSSGSEWNVCINSNEINYSTLLSEYQKLWSSEYSKQVTDETIRHLEIEASTEKYKSTILEEDQYPITESVIDVQAVINDRNNYPVRRKPHKGANSFFQIYQDELTKKGKNGDFNIVVACNYQASNQIVFSIPYSYLKENILPFAHRENNGRYLFNVNKNTHLFLWNRGIKMDGQKFILKQREGKDVVTH